MRFSRVLTVFVCGTCFFWVSMPLYGQGKVFTNSIGMEFVLMPAGSFMMGTETPNCPQDDPFTERNEFNDCMRVFDKDEIPQHKVVISQAFYMGKYEVTQEEWVKIMGDNSAHFKNEKVGGNSRRHPIEEVSWADAQVFITRLNDKEGKRYRLPTEAEWEYACRAGTTTVFNTGDNLTTEQANYDGEFPYKNYPKGKDSEKTTPVGSYRPNAWGLYDMHGNVWEFCQDWYDQKYYAKSPSTNPQGPSTGSSRILRGGGWYLGGRDCRSANRRPARLSERDLNIGFRIVLAL